jgi:hypothetical protein
MADLLWLGGWQGAVLGFALGWTLIRRAAARRDRIPRYFDEEATS